MFTNDGFGLLRVLSGDITSVIGLTVLIVLAVIVINRLIGANDPDGVKGSVRRIGFWVWVAIVAGFAIHVAASVTSLRIPRSDVNATSVYQQMDSAIEGKSTR